MDDFLKMDVFFTVTTAAVIVLAVLVGVLIVRLIRILKQVEHLVETAQEEAAQVREDLAALRVKAKREGLKLRHIVNFFSSLRKLKERSK